MDQRKIIFCICFAILFSITGNYARTIKWLDGTWEGQKYQTNMDKSWKMKLTCNSRQNIFTVEYPELNCKGNLVVTKVKGKMIILTEKIKNGSCVDDGYIIITFAGDGFITFTCLRDNKSRLASYCTLEKK